MNAEIATSAPPGPAQVKSAEERVADLRRRRGEAAAVLAETLLEMWLHDRRSRPGAAAPEAGHDG